MTTLILDPNISLGQAIKYMERIQTQGFDCWFKTMANKDKGTLEVHIIVEDKAYTILQRRYKI